MASKYIWSSPFIRGSSMACYLLQKAIENGHRNSWFTHWKWWFSIVMLVYQRVHVASLAIACDLSCTCLWRLSFETGNPHRTDHKSKQLLFPVTFSSQCAFGAWPEGCISTSQAWLELTEFRIHGDCNGISLDQPGHGSKMCATKRSSRPNLDRCLTGGSWQVCFLWHLGWGHLWT
jgi:hypothetical protein